MIQRVVIRYGQLIWPDSINVIFQFTSSKNFYLKKEEPRSPGAAKIL